MRFPFFTSAELVANLESSFFPALPVFLVFFSFFMASASSFYLSALRAA